MTSTDMQVLTLMLEKHLADTTAQMSEMKTGFADMKRENAEFHEEMKTGFADMKRENAEFREEIRQDMRTFEGKVTQRIDALDEKFTGRIDEVEGKLTARIDALDEKFTGELGAVHAEIGHIQRDITGLQHDVAGLYHWDYWLLSIILAVFVLPQFVESMKSVVRGLIEIAGMFRKGEKQQP